jgi:hypothetical protein
MKRKPKPLPDHSPQTYPQTYNDLWVAQHLNLKSGTVNHMDTRQPGGSARLLELADIALGNKKPAKRKQRLSATKE